MALFEKKTSAQPEPQQAQALQEDKAKHSLFGSTKQSPESQALPQIFSMINDILRRMRILEERLNNIRRSTQVTDQNMIMLSKKMNGELKIINSDINDFHKELQEIKDKLRLVIKELKLTAKYEDVKILNKYFEMWNPVKFVSQDEIDGIIERKLREYMLIK